MDVVGISKCVLMDDAKSWYRETARLKYSSSDGFKEAKSTIVTHSMIRVHMNIESINPVLSIK